MVIKGSGQLTDHNLDSSQKFYLGGPTGVRAYPSSEGSGSEGYLLNLELKKDLPFNLTGSIFYDEGYVRQNVDNLDASGAVINALNSYKGRKCRLQGSIYFLIKNSISTPSRFTP
jgi:hemolysin activation/secretion protein